MNSSLFVFFSSLSRLWQQFLLFSAGSKNRNTICRCKPMFYLALDNTCKHCNRWAFFPLCVSLHWVGESADASPTVGREFFPRFCPSWFYKILAFWGNWWCPPLWPSPRGIMVNHRGPAVTRHTALLCFAGSSWFVCYLGLCKWLVSRFVHAHISLICLSAALEKNARNVTAQWLPHQIHLGWVSTGGTGRQWNLSSVGFCSVDTCQPITFSSLSNHYSCSHWHLHVLTYYSFSSI